MVFVVQFWPVVEIIIRTFRGVDLFIENSRCSRRKTYVSPFLR